METSRAVAFANSANATKGLVDPSRSLPALQRTMTGRSGFCKIADLFPA